MTYWYKENYPPRGGIGEARLTIDDRKLNDVRVVMWRGDDALKTSNGASRLSAWIELINDD